MVANIPVRNRLEIPGGSSPFLSSPTCTDQTQGKGAHYVAQGPSEPPKIPGQVCLDYVPPHPPLSNPRKLHRYVFTLLESSQEGQKLDLSKIQSLLSSVNEESTERPQLQSRGR